MICYAHKMRNCGLQSHNKVVKHHSLSMTSTRTNTYMSLILFLLLQAFEFSPKTNAIHVLDRHKINILNQIASPIGSSEVIVHCAFKDDDFGNRTLHSGETMSWRFRTNFGRTTRYFCGFRWREKSKSFDVFSPKWKGDDFHHTYSYVVLPMGFYVSYKDDGSHALQKYNWDG